MANRTILANLNRCTGCWTCSMACKTAHDLEPDQYWQYIRTIGGGMLDEPAGEWPNLFLKWMPIWKQSCKGCAGDKTTEGKPFCVYNCPTGALTYGDLDDPASEINERLDFFKRLGYRVYENPKWEDTREGILYVEKGSAISNRSEFKDWTGGNTRDTSGGTIDTKLPGALGI